MIDLRTGRENAVTPYTRPNLPLFKVGKVISIHREDHSADVIFLDSNVVTQIPIMCNWLGSNFGLVHLTAPSYDPEQLARKTYPENEGAKHAKANTSEKGRDIYVYVAQVEGNYLGTAKMVIVGTMAPQVCEMLFPRHELNEDGVAAQAEQEGEFDDFMLFRHPSDQQVTLDKKGKLSVQHPNGSRITMGTDIGAVSLEKKDYDKLYELRHNKSADVSVYAIVRDASNKKRVDLLMDAGGVFHAAVYDDDENKKADLSMNANGEWEGAVYGAGEQETARVKMEEEGKLEGWAKREVKMHNDPGCYLILKQDGSAELHAVSNLKLTAGGIIQIQAGAIIDEDAPLITLN